jgi:hypothetical protein
MLESDATQRFTRDSWEFPDCRLAAVSGFHCGASCSGTVRLRSARAERPLPDLEFKVVHGHSPTPRWGAVGGRPVNKTGIALGVEHAADGASLPPAWRWIESRSRLLSACDFDDLDRRRSEGAS